MKNFFRKCIIFFLCVIVFSSSALPVYAAQDTARPEPITFYFLNAASTKDIPATCYYSDEYFYHSGAVENAHLRTMSLAMAMAAFQRYHEDDDYTDGCRNFNDLMQKAGFTDLFHNEAFDEIPTENSIGVGIASKKIRIFGVDYTLIAVGLRGADYGAEWAGNLQVGKEGQSNGFALAKETVLQLIRDYEKEHGITEHAKIWISGFSRGGAVANLVGAALNEDPEVYAVTKNDIYCYTCEAAQAEDASDTGRYPNIHNMVSPVDIVPLIPLAEWGLIRAGSVHNGQDRLYERDDFLVPAPGSQEYESGKETMLEHLKEINPELDYTIDSFREVSFNPLDKLPGRSQSEFIREMVSWVNSALPDRSRASYAEEYQDAFVTMARIFPGAGEKEMKKIPAAMKAALKDPEFYACLASLAFNISLRRYLSEEEYESHLKKVSDLISDNLIFHMKEAGLGLTEQDYQDFKEAQYPVIRFLDDALVDDIMNYNGYHLATLFFNMDQLMLAHCPDILLAWLEVYDSYYS